MAKRAKSSDELPPLKPSLDPDGRENQCIDLAVALAEKQLREGTASAQVICHYLKMASSKEKLERDIMEKQKELITAKTENLKAMKRMDEIYEDALEAMRRYQGTNLGEDSY